MKKRNETILALGLVGVVILIGIFVTIYPGMFIYNGGTPGCPTETSPPGAFELIEPVESVDPDTDGIINLIWSASAKACHYKVWKTETVPTFGEEVIIASGYDIDSRIYTDTVTVNKFYYYRIEAYNRYGYGVGEIWRTYTPWVCVKVEIALPQRPDEPIISPIAPDPDLDGEVFVEWSPDDQVASYELYIYKKTGEFLGIPIWEDYGEVPITGIIEHSYTITLVDNTYLFKVKAVGVEGGISFFSNEETVVVNIEEPIPTKPDAPELKDIQPDPDDDGKITLTWDKVDEADKYNIYRGKVSGSYNPIDTTTLLSYTDAGLMNGMYYYVVTAFNDYGESDYSNEESVEVDIGVPLDKPTLEPLYQNPDQSIHLEWSNVSADSYKIYRKFVDLSGNITDFQSIKSLTEISYNDVVTENGTYTYKITAIFGGKETGYSNEKSITVSIEPILPIDFTIIIILISVIIGGIAVILVVRNLGKKLSKKVR